VAQSPSGVYTRTLVIWAGLVFILFLGFGAMERTLLAGVSPERLGLLHLIRGLATSLVVALAVAWWLLRSARSLRDVVGVAPSQWAGARGDEEVARDLFGWLVRLRWLALVGVGLVLFVAGPTLGRLPDESAAFAWTTALLLVAYNAFLALAGPVRSSWLGRPMAQIVVDCLALAALVHFGGGIENPFLTLFVLHVANAGIALRPRPAFAILGVAVSLIMIVVVGEASGALRHYCIQEPSRCLAAQGFDFTAAGILGGLVLTLVATSSFTRSLTGRLREDQGLLRRTIGELRLEKGELAVARSETEREREKLRAIVDCMGEAVIFSDPEGRVVLRNRRATELWRALCSGERTLERCHGPDGWPPLAELFRSVADSDTPRFHPSFERRGHAFEATYAPVRSEDGKPLGLVMVARDVSERRVVERRLMQEERVAVVGKLAATVAHEINNPIGVIALYGQHALAKLAPRSPIREHLEIILRNAEACRKIVGDLLTLARPREPERRPVGLPAQCEEVLRSLAPLAERAGVTVRFEQNEGSLARPIEGDADALRQAVLNVVLNAIEASKRDSVVDVVVTTAAGHDAPAAVIEVHDQGEGIPAEGQERIFEPFYTTKSSGTGLGLAVAKNIVEGHGGCIEVESKGGRGSTFRIVLPYGGAAKPLVGVEDQAAGVS